MIPHDFGFKHMRKYSTYTSTQIYKLKAIAHSCFHRRSFDKKIHLVVMWSPENFIIDTPQKLKHKLEMVPLSYTLSSIADGCMIFSSLKYSLIQYFTSIGSRCGCTFGYGYYG